MLSVIIFSKNYASSTWCLDELVQILKCKERYGQMVVPVFYDINPSDVRKQHGNYADAFAQFEKRFKDSIDKVHKWRDALTTAANLSGFDYSNNSGTEADLIKKVVDHIWTKLICESSCILEGLVGIESRIQQIESVLGIHSQNACITVGIWGMGGIGKTTISETVFHRLSSKFEASCFLRNVRENSKQTNGLDHLEKTLLKEILKEGLSIGSTFVRERLSRTKVLIVLADVSDSMQMERLAGNRLRYGTGSRIIITSRDRSTLRQTVEEDKIYEVEGLKPDDALQLFCSRAFKNNSTCRTDYKELADKAVDYAGGIPLALILLGSSFLNCKSKEEWEDELNKLKEFPNENIQKVLRLSYDGLGRNEKEIFLDIACFYKGKHVDYVKKMLAIRGFFAAGGIRVLVDMSLISIDSKWKTIEMHDLLQEMGRTIVLEQCIEDPSKRNRLSNDEDVCRVLKSNTGTSNVQAILVNWSKIDELQLKRADFKKMSNLMWLSVNGKLGVSCELAGSVDLPDSLRYLYWCEYPLKSLPSKFSPENLVEIHMPESQVKELWNEDQRLVKLKVINLKYSKYLTEVPNLSGSPKIVNINLRGCESLVEIPCCFKRLDKLTHLDLGVCRSLKYLPEMPENIERLEFSSSGIQELPESVWSNKNISYLNLSYCKDLKKLPSNRCKLKVSGDFYLHGCESLSKFSELPRDISELHLDNCKRLVSLPTNICKLKSLKKLNLSGCSKLEKFPEILEPMEHLESESLILNETAVQEIHSSIEYFPALKRIKLIGCKRLSSVPESIWKLKSLDTLDLTGCSAFYEFPQILEPIQHLHFLRLAGTALEKLPSSIGNLIGLQTLSLSECKNLKVVPRSIYSLTNLRVLRFRDCQGLKELPSGSVGLLSLEFLDLCHTSISEIPDGLVGATSLQNLYLSGTMIRSIPASIKQSSRLHKLSLIGCKFLQSLPELPVRCHLEAQGCTSLKTVSSSRTALTQGWDKHYKFGDLNFSDCPKLDHNARSNIMDEAQLRIMNDLHFAYGTSVSTVCPGEEIPNWFSFGYQSEGSSVHIKLPQDWFRKGLWGFALSAVVSCALNCQREFRVIASFNVKFLGERHELFTSLFVIPLVSWKVNDYCSDRHHMYVWNKCFRSDEVAKQSSPDVYKLANEASVEFCSVDYSGKPISGAKVLKCGICPLYAEDAKKFKFDHVLVSRERKIQEETKTR